MYHPCQLEKRFGGEAQTPTIFWPPYVGPKFQTEEITNEITESYHEELKANPDLTKHPSLLKDGEETRDFKFEAPLPKPSISIDISQLILSPPGSKISSSHQITVSRQTKYVVGPQLKLSKACSKVIRQESESILIEEDFTVIDEMKQDSLVVTFKGQPQLEQKPTQPALEIKVEKPQK